MKATDRPRKRKELYPYGIHPYVFDKRRIDSRHKVKGKKRQMKRLNQSVL